MYIRENTFAKSRMDPMPMAQPNIEQKGGGRSG